MVAVIELFVGEGIQSLKDYPCSSRWFHTQVHQVALSELPWLSHCLFFKEQMNYGWKNRQRAEEWGGFDQN